MKYFIYTIIAIVASAVVAGFFVVGSPKEERMRKFDDRRTSDLQIIQGQIIYYWQNKGNLPVKLEDMKDSISGFNPPNDPETGSSYGYEVKGELEFKLCANFNLPTLESETSYIKRPAYPAPYIPSSDSKMQYMPPGDSNWAHNTGYICFERKVDRDLYKTLKLD
ncbi:MAG: hypothetical protein Q7K16_04365 [Candidatus Azambacteria bacterium]|nr:hypothetical protein [Candidatus Azambacteria bacterium]